MPPGTLFPTELPQYDNWVIREALHNCIAHQDYKLGGKVNIVEKPDELIFSNLGGFIPGDVANVIEYDVPPEKYRNPCLADAMVNMKLIDTIGSGIRKMFETQRSRYFPMPDYFIDNDTPKIEVRIAGKMIDEKYAYALISRKDISLHEVILLDMVQKGKAISQADAKALKGKKLIEGRSPSYFVSSKVADAAGERAKYIRNRGLDKGFYKGLIIEHLRRFGKATKQDFEELLLPKLPEVLNEDQKKYKVKNLLTELRVEGKIVAEGKAQGSFWKLA